MSTSAPEAASTRREQKRLETTRRLVRAAQALTRERGFDGWTMDELAAAADVSRRTAFNYFGAKVDAVLGPEAEVPPAALAEFEAGGPTGDLFDDIGALAGSAFDAHAFGQEELSQELVAGMQELLATEPRLFAQAHERMERIVGVVAESLLRREADEISPEDARLLLRLLVCAFDDALVELFDRPDQTFADALGTVIRRIRRLFA